MSEIEKKSDQPPKPKPQAVYIRIDVIKDAPTNDAKFTVAGNEFDTWDEAQQEISRQMDTQLQPMVKAIQIDNDNNV